ncbi:nitric oxide reductase activation protein NorD [Thalassovita mangrovi]|uniref:VWA domain-containing protein n=1 Tax=Thalassovita mangrovi TaxID=2692236 RepID=A0A6L8LEJ3_9RHOB|nr:VWA domain-containing protein [Thalassovita mangrovi]MYM54474.1 VWA domain-containing protein [Thalassovita mangrovi]
MTIDLEDYRACFAKAPPETFETVEAQFHDAARVMSAAGLSDYMEGARALCALGRGHDLVLAFLENMPAVARECGEDVIRDCVGAAMKLSSMTSGDVIALLFASLPTAARRLGDPELLRGYLQLIHQLSAKASRGLRPMLGVIDELLSKLTLSGLKRWANFGADAYRRDLANLTKYFALESADARKMLQQERRGTLFIDTQRKLNFYLRALWGRDFFLRPAAADYEGFRPYIADHVLHLPDAVDDIAGVSGHDLYRAMTAHLAAHIQYSTAAISAEQLSPAQMFFIGLIEDARVEYCAAKEFPGLSKLWGNLLALRNEAKPEHPTVAALESFAHLLSDPAALTGNTALDALGAKFHAGIGDNAGNNQFSWDLGLELFHIFAATRDVPSLRILNSLRIPYRDDNRFAWEFEEFNWDAHGAEYIPASQRQVRKYVSVMEMAHEVDAELAGDDAQEIWVCADNFMPYEDAGEATTSFNDMWGKDPVSPPFHYPEWDYQVQLYRPDWATVYEHRAKKGDPGAVDDILVEHKPIAHRIRRIIDMLSPAGVQRIRNMEDGDEIDINAAVDAMIAIRTGQQPNPRITMRNVITSRDLAVTVLLDLSESTNDTMDGSDKTVLELTREAAALVATAIEGIGDPFALHGFASDGRHDVQYYRFKDWGQSFNDEAKARLDGMTGGLSTRMGAALRHAGAGLLKQAERRKLILLVTDGEPADIDERDPQHLRHDTRKAVDELAAKGVMTYCLTLDPEADRYVKRIFGANNYTVVDHVDRLPEQLPTLFASLTG